MTYKPNFATDDIDQLFKAILSLDNLDECYRFFEDICTVKELNSIAQRLEVAKLLKEEKTYIEIEETTKASAATISRINKCLNYGPGGYKTVLQRLEHEDI